MYKFFVKENCVFVTGFVDDIREYYRAADLCVVPLHSKQLLFIKIFIG